MEPTTINATKLRIETRDLMERVKFSGERFIVKTFGRPMAVIISFEDFQRVKAALLSSRELLAPSSPLTSAATNLTQRKHKSRVRTKA